MTIYLLARVNMSRIAESDLFGASESPGRREGRDLPFLSTCSAPGDSACATARGLLTPLIPRERDRCHVDHQYGSASPASRPVRHRPRRVISHVRDQAHVRARQGPRQAQVTRGVITIADPPEDSRAEAEISASSFSTRNLMRDPQVRSRLFLHVRRHPAISFSSDSIRQHRGGWSVTGVLTIKGHAAPVELTVDGVSAEGAAIVFRADCTVDRYAHGITMMPGMAARRLSVQITARATRA
jgi:hypothetical protein